MKQLSCAMQSTLLCLLCLLCALALSGCSAIVSLIPTYNLEQAINQYNLTKNTVKLGDSIETVQQTFSKSEGLLTDTKWRKAADHYVKDNVTVDICYYRSDFTPDGLTTDDEFTPYIFNDGRLVGIGWDILGGPKSRGQSLMPLQQSTTGVRAPTIVF